MSQFDRPNPAAVPTLTEVIELLSPAPVSGPPASTAPIVTSGLAPQAPVPGWTPMSTVVVPTLNEVALPKVPRDVPVLDAEVHVEVKEPQPVINEAQLTQRILQVVQKQIDGMIEFRLKEAMAPILARHSEAMARELREELSRTMADVVARSVTQEIAKLRSR